MMSMKPAFFRKYMGKILLLFILLGIVGIIFLWRAGKLNGEREYVITQYPSITDKQAMCYSITDTQGHFIMIDGGWSDDAKEVRNLIMQNGGKVDVWILTHPHPDHIGAFNEIYADGDIEIDQIYAIPIDLEEYQSFANPWDEIEVFERFQELTKNADNITYVKEGDEFDICGLDMEVFHSYDYQQIRDAGSTDLCNDGGMIFKLSGKEKSMLFLADVGSLMSEGLASRYGNRLKADYVQMGHHGNGGSDESVLKLVNPEIAFFDCTDGIMDNPDLNAAAKRQFMEEMGAIIYYYPTTPNMVVVK